ncbi:hypothetical protein AB0I60_11505 [Actinosynnema sp. NPDC050436]|uniref:HAAS signaling domain-containing protein n=1 Tax=Actinosynnema sp. NPDC050436 TaxID=3155659 RepID=UPI0033D6CB94
MNRSPARHPLVTAYVDALLRAAAPLPRPRREELADEIRSHVDAVLPPDAGEARVREVLDRLGTPEEIVDAEFDAETPGPRGEPPRREPPVREPLRRRDVVGLLLVLVGGFAVPPVGYLVGAALVGTSRRWPVVVRVLLVGLPCVAAVVVVAGMVRDGHWYLLSDLVTDPRGAARDFLGIGVWALPFTALQAAALLVAHQLPLPRR